MARYLYSELASAVQARTNCSATMDHTHGETQKNAGEWYDKYTARIFRLVDSHLPHGSGFDSGTKIELDSSHADKLVFSTSYHHMDESGMYDAWTDHQVIVTPALAGDFHLRVTGRNYRDIKDYIHEAFSITLLEDIEPEITFERLQAQFPEFAVVHRWLDSCRQVWDVTESGVELAGLSGFPSFEMARNSAIEIMQGRR